MVCVCSNPISGELKSLGNGNTGVCKASECVLQSFAALLVEIDC